MQKASIVSMEMPTAAGIFRLFVWDGERGRELLALTTLSIDPGREVMVCVHSECLTGDTFHSLTCDCGPQKDLALKKIQEHGNGIFIYHRQEGRNTGLFKKIQAYNLMQQGMDTHEAILSLAGHPDPREYSEVLAVLEHILGNRKSIIRLLTNNPYKALFLERHGYPVIPEPLQVESSVHNESYTQTKTEKFLHNSIAPAPYVSVTLSRSDIQQHLENVSRAISDTQAFPGGRKLFIGIPVYPQNDDLEDLAFIDELDRFHAALLPAQNKYLVLHIDYPLARGAQRALKRFLSRLPFPYSLQFRLTQDSRSRVRIDTELIDSFHAEHVIFQLKQEHFYLLEQKSFGEYFSSPNKFLLLDESWGTGAVEDILVTRERILKLISHGLPRIGVGGGYDADNVSRIHELEDYFKIPISVDAESKLRTHAQLDPRKTKKYLEFFFPTH